MAVTVAMQDFIHNRTSITAVSQGVMAINPKATVIGKGSTIRIPLGVVVHVSDDYECDIILSDALANNNKVEHVTLAVHSNEEELGGYSMEGSVKITAKKSMALSSLDTLAFIKYKEKPLND